MVDSVLCLTLEIGIEEVISWKLFNWHVDSNTHFDKVSPMMPMLLTKQVRLWVNASNENLP